VTSRITQERLLLCALLRSGESASGRKPLPFLQAARLFAQQNVHELRQVADYEPYFQGHLREEFNMEGCIALSGRFLNNNQIISLNRALWTHQNIAN
jgi:3-hydroxymyristoyl/3-hydroxydecanoyl-(acyl carrier protein) dehydratase